MSLHLIRIPNHFKTNVCYHTLSDTYPTASTAEEIVENLPKVWRVLMELLSHQAAVEDLPEKITTCYKLVQTKSGPVEVPSVSQTYIRLKVSVLLTVSYHQNVIIVIFA